MFTIYKPNTGTVYSTVTARTRDIAYLKAERICERFGGGDTLVFDDTCDHGTAYDLCSSTDCNVSEVSA